MFYFFCEILETKCKKVLMTVNIKFTSLMEKIVFIPFKLVKLGLFEIRVAH